MRKLTAVFQIILGAGIIGIWVMLFLSGRIPEIQTEPLRIAMHIAAEFTTGCLLLISGIYSLIKSAQHRVLFNLSFGALIYTLIVSPGYYADRGEWPVFAVFMIMLVITVLLILLNSKTGRSADTG